MHCSNCGSKLQEDANFCSKCGSRVADIVDRDTEPDSEVRKTKSTPQDESKETSRSWLISAPMYGISWIAVIGCICAVVLGPPAPLGGWALCFWCGAVTAITAKRKNKSGWLWFFIGLIPIGFLVYFLSYLLRTVFLQH